jgi:hypothetical protein
MEICTVNNFAVVVPPDLGSGLKSETKSGVSFVKQKSDIAELELKFNGKLDINNNLSRILSKGSKVYVPEHRLYTMPFGKSILKMGGQDILLIPASEIVGYKEVE